MLPELKTGDIVISKGGERYYVIKVNNKRRPLKIDDRGDIVKPLRMRKHPHRNTGYDEPLYRLRACAPLNPTGAHEWTLDELNKAGVKVEENH